MDQKCDLFFPLPEQKEIGRSEIKLILGAFRTTLSDLPFGNQEKSAKEIFDILYKSNKILLKYEDRQELLKQIEEQAPQVIAGLRNKIKDVTVPVGRSEERVAKILVGLHYELALAYRCLLSQKPESGLLSKPDNSASVDNIRLTIFHLGEILRTKYSVFANPSGTIWRYIYTLFICSSNQNTHKLKLPSSKWCDLNTVEEAFKSILLMSMSSPLTMRGKEFSALYDLTPELTKYITLGKINCGESYHGLMTFNLSGTESPKKQFATGCDSCSNASNCFTVNTASLVQHLEEQEGQIKDAEKLSPLQRLLNKGNQFKTLIQNLSATEQVDHENRIKGGGSLELVAGFSDICTFLSKRAESETVSTNEEQHLDDWTTSGEESITVEEAVDWTATGIVRAGLRKTTCNVINHSRGGYCLYKDTSERFHLRVGELAMVKESEKNTWKLVVIIWVSGDRNRMDFGVKIIDGIVSKVTLRRLNNHNTEKTIDSLLLKIEDGNDQNSIRIIVSAPDLHAGERLLVDYSGVERTITVADIHSKTDGYVEYGCDWSGSEKTQAISEDVQSDKAVPDETNFESIWDQL